MLREGPGLSEPVMLRRFPVVAEVLKSCSTPPLKILFKTLFLEMWKLNAETDVEKGFG